jgi:beta-glucosidase
MITTHSSTRRLYFLLRSLCLLLIPGAAMAAPLGPEHPLEVRVDSLIQQMTLEEKASQLVSWPEAIPRLGIPKFVWDNEGKHAFVASFPVSIGLAATWNPQITQRVAVAISDEARAQNNVNIRDGKTQRFLCFWAPTVNMARDPRWGRVNESFGEDPFLTSKHSVAFIRGMQGDHPSYLKAAAGVNHFAVYSEERDRHSVDASLTNERLLRDYYLPHFEASVKQGNAAAVGATNNGLNGVPLCVNRPLLTNILRHEWGFKGFVFSDAASVEDIWQLRGYAPDGATASALTINAGCEINTGLGNTHAHHLPEAVQRGLVSEAAVDEALRRVLTVQFRLGIYDPPAMVPYSQIPESVIDSLQHRQLALEAARESIVLLKNEKSILPLDLSKLKRILVAGPRADQPELGRKQTGSSAKNVSALEGIRNQAGRRGVEVLYEKDRQKSVEAARSSDVVLFFTSLMEGEVTDRMNLGLSPRQEQHLLELTATKVPVVVVLIGSGCVTMERWENQVSAMLCAWYPGKEGGNAIADVLFGVINPGAKLPVTFYRSSDQLKDFTEFDISKGLTYLYCKTPVQYAFGHGLSYTTFKYTNLQISPDPAKPDHFAVSATITNTGSRPGQEVAQLYLHAQKRSSGDQPLQQLRGFEKFALKPGETHTVTWSLSPSDLAFHAADLSQVVEPGEIEVRVGGSSDDPQLTGTFMIPERIILRSSASFQFAKLSASPAETTPDEPITIRFDVENTGDTTGTPEVKVDGEPHPCMVPAVGPGEKVTVSVDLRLHNPGPRSITVGNLPAMQVTIKPTPPKFTLHSIEASPTALAGQAIRVGVKVRNIGGETGTYAVPLRINGDPPQTTEVRLEPGETTTAGFNLRFDQSGTHVLAAGDSLSQSIQVGAPPEKRFQPFSNTSIAEFKQSAPGDFFIRATGIIGNSWIEENNGGDATSDAYAALYLPKAAKAHSVIKVKIQSLDLVSNHTKAGIMIRNSIPHSGKPGGYLIHGINGYYGGVGNIEWDQDEDGYLESHAVFDPGGYPKWLALEKNGSTFRCFYSSDQGQTWKLHRTIQLGSAVDSQDVGLFVASDTEDKSALVRFSDFEVKDGLFAGRIVGETVEESKKQPEQPF